ncbi:MAG TPA: hypothetical protein VMT68_08205 [Caulobacteraceae bacterium]|nr:hypothetical protein [Caulobacteraceae bacterium]
MRRLLLGLGVLGVLAVAGAVVFLLWDLDWRWRPHTITRHQAEIGKALDQAGWVSPHLTGPKLYMISFRSCSDCVRFEKTEFPKLQKADVDTRVIVIARSDSNGQAHSTPAERNTVAELWTNRSWRLYQQWSLANPSDWAAPGIAPADGDAARTAVIGVGRGLAAQLAAELKESGVDFAYPTLVWWTKDGRMRACACVDPQTYRFVEQELGA